MPNLKPPVNEPERIEFNGRTYDRVAAWQAIDDVAGIAEGPLYMSDNEADDGFLFMPDLAYLMNLAPLTMMHRITNY